MKSILPYLLVVFIFFNSCSQNNINKVSILINAPEWKSRYVELSSIDILTMESTIVGEATVDSGGNALLALDVAKPFHATLRVDEEFVNLYLSPGNDVEINFSADPMQPITFRGKDAEINKSFVQINAVKQKNHNADGKQFFELSPNEFKVWIDSLSVVLNNFSENYKTDSDIDESSADLVNRLSKIYTASLRLNYKLMHPEAETNVLKVGNRNSLDEIIFEERNLRINTVENAFLMHMYFDNKFAIPMLNTKISDESLPVAIANAIKKGNYPNGVESFLLAKNISEYLERQGHNSILDSLHTVYKKAYSTSDYLPALQKKYDKYLAISKGRKAPEIMGINQEGKKSKLSDYKGKVVYIDVWATWCGSCIEEFPYSKQLEKEFSGNKDVAFLYVSVDEDVEAWRKFLLKKGKNNDTHILEQSAEVSIWDAYLIRGIPRFILVDKEGNIVDAFAPNPSSGKVSQQIKSILNEDV